MPAAGLRRRLLLALCAAAALPAWALDAAEPLRLPTLAPRRRRLPNGLDVVLLPDAAGSGAGTVAVQVWYRVGGQDDPPGRSGFAHLFEHMMFIIIIQERDD